MRRSPISIWKRGDYEDSGLYYDLAIETNGEDDRLLYMRGTCSMLLAAMRRR